MQKPSNTLWKFITCSGIHSLAVYLCLSRKGWLNSCGQIVFWELPTAAESTLSDPVKGTLTENCGVWGSFLNLKEKEKNNFPEPAKLECKNNKWQFVTNWNQIFKWNCRRWWLCWHLHTSVVLFMGDDVLLPDQNPAVTGLWCSMLRAEIRFRCVLSSCLWLSWPLQ